MSHLGRRANDAPAWLLLSKICLPLRDATNAIAAARRATELNPSHAEAVYALGRAHRAAGDAPAAEACYRRALAIDPNQPDVLTSLGIVLRSRGETREAVLHYRQALSLDPHHVEASNNLGNVLIELGEGTEARQLHETGKPALAHRLNALRNAADAFLAGGQVDQAFGALSEALRLAPGDADLWLLAGQLAAANGQSQTGLDYIEQAAQLDPQAFAAAEIARRITVAAGLHERAAIHTARVQALAPSPDAAMAGGLLLPSIQQSRETIEESRAAYLTGLQAALATDAPLTEPTNVVGVAGFFVASHPSFYLAYHGACNRDFQQRLARVFLQRLPGLETIAPHCTRPVRRPGRLRIGFISRFLCDHSIGKTSRGLIERLDKDRFEAYVLRITPSSDDGMTAAIKASADHTVELPTTLPAAHERIGELELDVLFYQDIGMEPMAYLLAFARLAPVQCVSFGHPDTTGIPNLDYFVSNDAFETAGAQAHYTEELFLLHGLPTLAYYHRPATPDTPLPRGQFGFDETDTLYVCPQTLFKVHPDFDQLMLGILRRDPRGVIVFIEGEFRDLAAQLRTRFEHTVPGFADRIRFLPRLAHGAFMRLLLLADVILDTLHFNGMNSSLEAFAVGTPVVTLPGALQRARHTQAMYRHMGILDAIANDTDDYVEIALRLGNDVQFAASMRRRIRERSHRLFADDRVVREFERFFETAIERTSRARLTSPG